MMRAKLFREWIASRTDVAEGRLSHGWREGLMGSRGGAIHRAIPEPDRTIIRSIRSILQPANPSHCRLGTRVARLRARYGLLAVAPLLMFAGTVFLHVLVILA